MEKNTQSHTLTSVSLYQKLSNAPQSTQPLRQITILQVALLCILIGHQAYLALLTCHLENEHSVLAEEIKKLQLDVNEQGSRNRLADGKELMHSTLDEPNVSATSLQSGSLSSSENHRIRRSDGRNNRRGSRRNAEENGESQRRGSRKVEAIHLEVNPDSDNLRIEHEGAVLDVWSVRDDNNLDFGEYKHNGTFVVNTHGLYLIYSQMTYYDNSGRWCHAIKRNQHTIAKCLASEWGMAVEADSDRYVRVIHNCYTSLVTVLRAGDHLSITSLYDSRIIHEAKDMSFWGIVKLA